jgi:tetratricopeptide (TPR) repeat protein
VAETLIALGLVLYNLGELDACLENTQRALDIRRAAFGPEHVLVGDALEAVGAVFEVRAQVDSAEAYYREGNRVLKAALGADHPGRADGIEGLGRLLGASGRRDEAIELLREAVELEKQRGENHSYVAYALKELAKVLRNRGDLEEADRTFREALRIYDIAFPEGGLYVASTRVNYGRLLYQRGDLAGAESELRRGVAEYRRGLPESATARWRAETSLGVVLMDRRRYAEAESLLTAAYRVTTAGAEPDPRGAAMIAARLVQLYETWERPGEAEPYRETAERWVTRNDEE